MDQQVIYCAQISQISQMDQQVIFFHEEIADARRWTSKRLIARGSMDYINCFGVHELRFADLADGSAGEFFHAEIADTRRWTSK